MSSKKKKSLPKSQDLGTNAIDAVKNLVDQVTVLVGQPTALSATDIRRSAKLRKGGEAVIPTIAALSDQFGLAVPSRPTAVMMAKLNKAQALIPLHKQMVTALKQVSDAIFSAQSESWADATVHYSMLRRLARTNGDLEAAITPVQQFFARKSPAVVEAEDAKRGHRKGAKAPKVAKATPVVDDAPDANTSDSAPTPAPQAATPSPTPTQATPAPTSNAAHS